MVSDGLAIKSTDLSFKTIPFSIEREPSIISPKIKFSY